MEARQLKWVAAMPRFVVALLLVLLLPVASSAQEQRPSIFSDLIKVSLDPTTYAPALLGYNATMRDWDTSQVFFRNGFVEGNANFTVSGLPDDQPITYEAGRHQILRDSIANLEISLAHNIPERLFEHALIEQYPNHRRLITSLGWVERIAVGSALAYKFSAVHYRQAAENERLAAQLGLK